MFYLAFINRTLQRSSNERQVVKQKQAVLL